MASSNAPILQAIPPALAFLVPLFAVVLLLLALSHRPAHAQGGPRVKTYRANAVAAYIAIAVLALFSTIAGALGLRTALSSDDSRSDNVVVGARGAGELVVEALVFLEVGASVLYLANEYVTVDFKVYWVIALVIELVCATAISLAFPFTHGEISIHLPPALSLLFIASVLPLLIFALRAHIAKQKPNNTQQSPPIQTTPRTTPSFSGTRLSGQNVSPPLPASSLASLPSPSSDHEKLPSAASSTSDLTIVNHFQTPYAIQNRHLDANALELGNDPTRDGDNSALSIRIVKSRSRSLLFFLMVSQFAAFVAFVLEIAAVNVALSETRNSVAYSDFGAGSVYAILQIVRTALMVLCITGVMSAFLLHAYNAYLRAASAGRQSTTDNTILPPTLDLSRMNTITVSLSTTATSPLPSARKKCCPPQPLPPSAFERTAKKFCLQGRFANVAVGTVHSQVVFSETDVDDHDVSGSTSRYDSKHASKASLCHHVASKSASSSFASPMPRSLFANSMLLSSDSGQDKYLSRMSVRDSKFDDDDIDVEPGYAYIYTDMGSSRAPDAHERQTDPLDVGLPVPFRGRQLSPLDARGNGYVSKPYSPLSSAPQSLSHSHNSSAYTNDAVENSFSSALPPSPLNTPSAPIDIPLPKPFSNPYPTPRSTPTTAAFTTIPERPSTPQASRSPIQSALRIDTCRPTTSSSKASGTFVDSPFEMDSPMRFDRSTDRFSQCSTPTPTRDSTPTPTRAPTPGLSFTPFIGNHVRKRDSTSSKKRPHTPSPPSSFMANLKDKAKTLSTKQKHDSIGESLAQGLEGIRNGLGSNGKTKYPLRTSTSHSSLGLGLGISSGFKFPQLTRRASEIDKGSRNRSTSTLATTAEGTAAEEGDFTNLRDPFASPTIAEGGVLRIVSATELNLRSGRESRTGYREEDIFDFEREGGQNSYGRSRGTRISAWGKFPLSNSSPSSPIAIRDTHRPMSPTAAKFAPKLKHRGDKSPKGKSKGRSSGSSKSVEGSSGIIEQTGPGVEDVDFALEEALLAQQLLMRLDENLVVAQNSSNSDLRRL